MQQKNGAIVVVECISSSVNYIKDILYEGYEPVLLELGCPAEDYPGYRINHDFAIEELFNKEYPALPAPRIMKAGENYGETLEMMRQLKPRLIVPGGDDGIWMAMKLSHDLGLLTNHPDLFEKMKNKYVAQQALKAASIRCIKSKIVHSRQEADQFYQELGCKQVVFKPVAGAASVGVHICMNDEMYRTWLDSYSNEELNSYGILMQERIAGTEYVFNTVSCQGQHKVTGLMRYDKVLLEGYANRYETSDTLDPSSDIALSLIDYGFKVLDAIGIQYGPVHSEIMIDEAGPVLIEANCRLCGGALKAGWLDRIFGNHESNVSLQAYLHPEAFFADKRQVLMDGKEYGVIKFLSIEQDTYIKKINIDTVLKDIPGYVYANKLGEDRMYHRTVDFSTVSGMVYLAHEDPEVIKHSLELIDDIQKNQPELLYESR